MMPFENNRKRTRMIVRRGREWIAIKFEEMVMAYTENRIVFVIDRDGNKFMSEKNLAELENELDPGLFFRANRQFIINSNYIRGFKSFEKVKLLVEIKTPEIKKEVIISQENAPHFRNWLYNA